MNNHAPKNIAALCAQDPAMTHPDGRVNHNAVSRILKIPQSTITRILNGTCKSISERNLRKIAEHFGVTVDEIINGPRNYLKESPGTYGSKPDPLRAAIADLTEEERKAVLLQVRWLKAQRAASGNNK